MGYAIAGYPTRRRKGQRHHVKLLQHPQEESQKAKKRRRKHGGLAELPIEIIQRIFVLSQNESLCLANKFFHAVLRPSASLLGQMVWEKYIINPSHYGVDLGGSLIMLDTVFTSRAFIAYLTENMQVLDCITRFIPLQVWQEFQSNDDDNAITSWWEQDAPMDYPAVFHARFEPYLDQAQLVKRLSRFFLLKDPYNILKDLIYWFFMEEPVSQERLERLYEAVELVLEVANIESCKIYSSEPLETLLHVLFVEHKTSQPLLVFRTFLDKFYTGENAQEHLSDPSLWRLLRSTSNMQVIDTIVSYGGQPHYGAFF
ncbi:uncharacterized protein ZBIST_2761 [Zygosaccharomyces bailii]|nr:uncharacterized protein ZBIST_2761 [Zygosaccharomyces bailii]